MTIQQPKKVTAVRPAKLKTKQGRGRKGTRWRGRNRTRTSEEQGKKNNNAKERGGGDHRFYGIGWEGVRGTTRETGGTGGKSLYKKKLGAKEVEEKKAK